MEKTCCDLLVWVVEIVGIETGVISLDCQITGLVHQSYRSRTHIVRSRKSLHRNFIFRYIVEIVFPLFEIADKECRSAGLEPIHTKSVGSDSIQQT